MVSIVTFSENQSGITGLETAIVLITFIRRISVRLRCV
jgi:hypothetical protein